MVLFRVDSMRKVDSNTFVNSAWSKIHNVLIAEYVGNKAKGRILKRVFQKKSTPKFSKKRTFLTHWYEYAYTDKLIFVIFKLFLL